MQFILSSGANLLTGLWLLIAPTVLMYFNSVPRGRSNDLVIGITVATLAAIRLFGNYRSGRLNQVLSWLTVLPGIWLIASPFLFDYADMTSSSLNAYISGAAIILFALWSALTSRRDYHDGNTIR